MEKAASVNKENTNRIQIISRSLGAINATSRTLRCSSKHMRLILYGGRRRGLLRLR